MNIPKPHRTLTQEVWNATLWNTLLFPARFLVGIVASVIYYQKLSLEQVAIIFLLTNLAATVGLYADLGIERALPRYLPEVEQRSGRLGVLRFLRRIIGLKLAILALFLVILNGLALPLGHYLADEQRTAIGTLEQQIITLQTLPADAETPREISDIREQIVANSQLIIQIEAESRLFMGAVSALLILGALFDVFMQFLTAYFKQRAWNLITLATTLLQPVLVTTFVVLGWGIKGVLLGLVVTPLVSVLLAAWQAHRASRELVIKPVDAAPDLSLVRRFSRFAGVSYLLQVTTWLYDVQFVLFFAAALLGPRDVALLGFGYKFAKDYLGYVWMPLSGVMTPLLARIKLRRDSQSLRDAHASLTRLIWLIIVPSGVGLALLTPRLIATLYPKYIEASSLILVFILFTFGESLLSVPHNVLMVYEQYRAVIISRLAAFSVIPLVFILLPRFGLLGIAVGVGVVRVATRLITVVYGVRHLGLTLPVNFQGRVIAASASFAFALIGLMYAWPAPPTPQGTAAKALAIVPLLVFTVIGALLYLVVLRLLGGLDQADRERLLGMRLPFKRVLAKVL